MLLKRFQRFVLFGEQKNEDDGLYPLPPGAYKERMHQKFLETRKEKEEAEKNVDNSSSSEDSSAASKGTENTEAKK